MSKVYSDLATAMDSIVGKMEDVLRRGGYDGAPIDMFLAGGMAVNYYCGTRYTEDVDASFSRRVLFPADQIVADYVRSDGKPSFIYLDTNYNPTFALMHENFQEDSLPWSTDRATGSLVNLRVLAPVDLAVSKISRFTDRDREDIKALAAEGLITEDELRKRAEEALVDYVGNVATVKTSIRLACEDVRNACAISAHNAPVPDNTRIDSIVHESPIDPLAEMTAFMAQNNDYTAVSLDVQKGGYCGPFVFANEHYAVQSIGRGNVAIHDVRAWDTKPAVEQSGMVQYRDGVVSVAMKDLGLEPRRGGYSRG